MTPRDQADRDKQPRSAVRGPKAIQTNWAGCTFRSRAEARVAVFLQQLGLRWQYEPQGFMVGAPPKRPYLPDFYVSDIGLWLEIKPRNADRAGRDIEAEMGLWQDFAAEVATEWDHDKAAMWVGDIPDPALVDREGPPRANSWYDDGIVILGDWHYAWCACPTGQHFDIQPLARGGLIECGCPRISDGRFRSGNYPLILSAYSAARTARFEHGEKPAVTNTLIVPTTW